MTTLLTVKSSELQLGDVVHCHGMLCLIDRPIESGTGNGYGPVYWTLALVTNRDDEATRAVPMSWTADWKRNGKYEPKPHDGVHRWAIQGNDNAQWSVERAS